MRGEEATSSIKSVVSYISVLGDAVFSTSLNESVNDSPVSLARVLDPLFGKLTSVMRVEPANASRSDVASE